MKYWIYVLTKDHVQACLDGGFVQASHGKPPDLHLLHRGDVVFFYSPGTRFRAGELLQAFTGAARVADDMPFQSAGSGRTGPWRRAVTALPHEEAAIAPLVSELDCVEDKARWAASMRRGLIEIGEPDARRVAGAMRTPLAPPIAQTS